MDDTGMATNDLHIFDVGNTILPFHFHSVQHTWSSPTCGGNIPAPRYGHSMVAIGTRLFVFGGLYGSTTVYGDLFVFDTGE